MRMATEMRPIIYIPPVCRIELLSKEERQRLLSKRRHSRRRPSKEHRSLRRDLRKHGYWTVHGSDSVLFAKINLYGAFRISSSNFSEAVLVHQRLRRGRREILCVR